MKHIGLLTKQTIFDFLVNQFKRSGIEVTYINHQRDIKPFDVIIVDLGYPKELAYTFLTQIQTEQNYSDKILIAAVSNKTQVQKLRSITLGCDDYISPQISYKELVHKIKTLEDPSRYVISKKFNDTETRVSFEASLTHISENGCILSSRVSLSQVGETILSSSLIDDLKFNQDAKFRPKKSNPMARRSFLSEINFLNLQEEDRQNVRKLLLSWSAK